MEDGHSLRAVLCQVKPRKGNVQANIAAVREALVPGADISVFPETVLSGYFVEGAALEVALSPGGLVDALGPPPTGCDGDVVITQGAGNINSVLKTLVNCEMKIEKLAEVTEL